MADINMMSVSSAVTSLSFTIMSAEEIERQSVMEVNNVQTFDLMGHPTRGGLYDGRMGALERDEVCDTCSLSQLHCPGHIGHIPLPLPVFNPIYFRDLHKLLRGSCFTCHRLLAPPAACQTILAQLQVLEYGLVGVAGEIEEIASEIINVMSAQKCALPDIASEVRRKIEQFLQNRQLCGDDPRHAADVKNVVEMKHTLIKNFSQKHLMKPRKKCLFCGESKSTVQVQEMARFIFNTSKNTGRPAKVDNVEKVLERALYGSRVDLVDDDEEMLVDNEDEEKRFLKKEYSETGAQTFFTAVQAKKHLRDLWILEHTVMGYLFGSLREAECRGMEHPTDMFFMDVMAVSPPKFRPCNFVTGKKYEHQLTACLNRVLRTAHDLQDILVVMKAEEKQDSEGVQSGKTPSVKDQKLEMLALNVKALEPAGTDLNLKLHHYWKLLQTRINALYDSDLDRNTKERAGVKQVLEKKAGLVRKHMMGKRVNFAARSVISPDPYINVDEIGVPMVFATRLSYPVPVTPRNVEQLRQAVINGPDIYPGALLVEFEDGRKMRLDVSSRTKREAVAKTLLTPNPDGSLRNATKIVHRHLQSGDMLLLNRQPTLHKPSIMAHRARVLRDEKTLRLHYANCKAYNADFDGDEMNAHLPQSELGRAEAHVIASVNEQYLVPKDGTPLSGLIQDHVIGGTLLTMQDKFFNREDYQTLVFSALTFLNRRIETLPPAIYKPVMLWTGKQIVSTVITNCCPLGAPPPTVYGKTKVPAKAWLTTGRIDDPALADDFVLIRDGELLCGVLDKAHYGPSQYGLVHVCYELYGGEVSSLILSGFARLFTHYLQIMHGFTLGIRDILVTEEADRKRRKIMRKGRRGGNRVVLDVLNIEEDELTEEQKIEKLRAGHLARSDHFLKSWDAAMKKHTDFVNNEINKACMPNGLQVAFPSNNLQLMVQSGAKGGTVNCMQISCLLGQIELEGRRVPLNAAGRSLPSFRPYDTSPRAGGFIDGRFLTGIRPQEFFFHCMAGREGLVDTAVKTSRSGYLQRCLVKHLEGIMVNYDQTVRDSDGSVIQFQYGEDGLDILKMQMIQSPTQFPALIRNAGAIMDTDHIEQTKSVTDTELLEKMNYKVARYHRKIANGRRRESEFTIFCQQNEAEYKATYPGVESGGRYPAYRPRLVKAFYALNERERRRLRKQVVSVVDTVSSVLRPDLHIGVVGEKLHSEIEKYIESNPDGLILTTRCDLHEKKVVSPEDFRDMVHLMHQKSLTCAGEPVGLLAAQSIGEPSTQMTLNTFHFAGRGEMNVTLGIPRLREILMVASKNISTPSMSLPLKRVPSVESRAEKLRLGISQVSLAQVLESVSVTDRLDVPASGRPFRVYHIRFNFLPYRAYKKILYINPSKILRFMESKFLKRLIEAVRKKITLVKGARMVEVAAKMSRANTTMDNEHDEGGGRVNFNEDDDGDSSGDDEGGEGETNIEFQREKHEDDRDYDEPEIEEYQKSEDES
ncbi:DNA-directed RNA polymerase I subunit RPA1-like, partial [Tropilaelaps mercedesae]